MSEEMLEYARELRAANADLKKEAKDLRAQRDQAVLLAIEAREALKLAMVIDFSSNPEKRKPCDVVLAKLQSLNPPPGDDTLKV